MLAPFDSDHAYRLRLEPTSEGIRRDRPMPIRADQINDILSTLVVMDHGARGSTSVSLPIEDSAADRLADLPPELRQAGGLVAILAAFRGSDVIVRTDTQRVAGRVVGVEDIGGLMQVTVLTASDAMIPLPVHEIVDVVAKLVELALFGVGVLPGLSVGHESRRRSRPRCHTQ